MALVDLSTQVTFSLVDGSGSKGQVQINADSDATLADIRTAANALVPLIQAITGCGVNGYSIGASTIETVPVVGAVGSRVEKRGLFSFRTDAGKIAQITIPGILPAVVLPSGRIDDDAPTVEAFLTPLLAAPWTDSNNSGLSQLVEAYETYRTTRKRQKPSQRTPDADEVVGN